MIYIYSLLMILGIIILMSFGLYQVAIAVFITNFVAFIGLMLTDYYIKFKNRKK